MREFVIDKESVSVPDWVQDLESFRRWADSDDFPEHGQICWLKGLVWVDMSMEQFFSHNQLKGKFTSIMMNLVDAEDLGRYVPDGMRLSNEEADLSAEPDGAFLSHERLDSGAVRLVEGRVEGFVELEGSPDMVLEIVSTSSVKKDTETLRELYWKAGVREYWLVDARGEKLLFDVLRHTARGYVATKKQDGWIKSAVFGRSFQLLREQDRRGDPKFTLAVRP